MKLQRNYEEDWEYTKYPTPFFKKQLSNIPEALQVSQEFTKPKLRPSIPMSKQNKQKTAVRSQVTLQNKLKKILRSPQPNHRSHNSTPNNKYLLTHRKQKSQLAQTLRNPNIFTRNLHSTLSQMKGYDRQSQLPVITAVNPPIKIKNPRKKSKSVLDKILTDRQHFAKSYFQELNKIQKMNQRNKNRNEQELLNKEQKDIEFEFPEIVTGAWRVWGFIVDEYILLKGVHRNGEIMIKKYQYEKVYAKLRKDYQSWVQLKFSFQN